MCPLNTTILTDLAQLVIRLARWVYSKEALSAKNYGVICQFGAMGIENADK